jgi:Domain of unknown function (DUF4263)
MALYERDYTVLTDDEREILKRIENRQEKAILGTKVLSYKSFPKAIRHYKTLFPNHYLDVYDLKTSEEPKKITNAFLETLNSPETTERTLLDFIKKNKAYFIIGSLMNKYHFGHHDAFIFPEFQLGSSYQVDYLLVGRSSGGYEFIFVELEDPYKQITLKDGELGAAFRKGIRQVVNWKHWLEENFESLNVTFEKYKHPNMMLPKEFFKLDMSRYHYIVVAGRRKDFNEKTYRLARLSKLENKIELLHYDNLYDSASGMLGRATY